MMIIGQIYDPPFCSVKQNQLPVNFGRDSYEEHLCDVILNKGQQLKKFCLCVLILYVPVNSFLVILDGSFWVETVLNSG